MSAASTERKPFRIYYGDLDVRPDPLDPLEEDRRIALDLLINARENDVKWRCLALQRYIEQIDNLQKKLTSHKAVSYDQRQLQLADECGRLADENRELKVENCELRRRIERLERGKR